MSVNFWLNVWMFGAVIASIGTFLASLRDEAIGPFVGAAWSVITGVMWPVWAPIWIFAQIFGKKDSW